jgi:spore coat polysaccharide biosynthesis protein SpsF
MPKIVAIIQARTGSSRLPGKVMFPLGGEPVLSHVIKRVNAASEVDKTIVATSIQKQDNVIAQYTPSFGADVHRGSESNVLSRFYEVVRQVNPQIIVRITADCPLISPQFLDYSISQVQSSDVDYTSASLNRTFPRGVTAETFTAESFKTVYDESTQLRHQEHVTPYYRENPDKFNLLNIESVNLFDEEWLRNRTDLRLTLDEADDYRLLETVYREVKFEGILSLPEAIRYIDENDLSEINQGVEQKSI